MKSIGAIHRLWNIRCLTLGKTREDAAKEFGVSWQFILSVLTYKRPMPEWMVQKMVDFLEVEPGVIGAAYGYYPHEWLRLSRETPEVIHKGICAILKKLKPSASLELNLKDRYKISSDS